MIKSRLEDDKKADMFSVGCILYFCLSGGRHPFYNDDSNDEALDFLVDEDSYDDTISTLDRERSEKIEANNMDLSMVEDMPEAFHLISLLLSPDPQIRYMPNHNSAS